MRADSDKKYLWRLALIALACTAMSLWFFYDGMVTYPNQRERAIAHRALIVAPTLEYGNVPPEWISKIAKENGGQIEDKEEVVDRVRKMWLQEWHELAEERGWQHAGKEWQELADEHGWPKEDPGEPKAEADIAVQKIIAILTIIPGVLYAIFFLLARRRWIESTEDGIRTSWKQQLKFDEIVSLDKKLWRSKGIARIRYEQDGRKRRLTLDDWKYYAEPTKAILRQVESRIDESQIVNGAPEPPPEEAQPQDSAAESE